MKVIAVDIGNTRIKPGEFYNSELIRTLIINDPLEIKPLIYGSKIDVVLSSVVPKQTSLMEGLLKNHPNTDVYLINHEMDFGFSIKYDPLCGLGIDRLCSISGAKQLLELENSLLDYDFVITFDFGTASTVNVLQVSKTPVFTGGMIAPGLKIMNSALNHHTSKLPLIEHFNISSFLGNSTDNAIRSGIINSTIGLVERVYNHFYALSPDIKIFITGGYADALIPHLQIPFQHEPFLNLIGIYSIYYRNKK
jgi:type III pantothenate kinase